MNMKKVSCFVYVAFWLLASFEYVIGGLSEDIELERGRSMPRVGLGTAGIHMVGGLGHSADLVKEALDSGVRMVDTAQAPEWYSEEEVGNGLLKYDVKEKGMPYLVTKIHPRSFEYDAMERSLYYSKEKLGLDKDTPIDLVLLHAPTCWEVLLYR